MSKIYFFIIASISIWLVLSVVNVKANILETLQVSSLNSIPVFSNVVLETGKTYLIEVTGTYTFSGGGRIADAEFAYNPDTNSFYEELEVANKEYNLDLFVDNAPQDWLGSVNGLDYFAHTYSPDHKYKIFIQGQGVPASFYIYDSSYDWNEGSLVVSINNILPTDKNECKNQNWRLFFEPFKSQGLCIRNVKTF